MFARRVKQAGGVVYRVGVDGARVLLVRARKDPSHWIFPKGHIDPCETSADAAVREVKEEAGVTGHVVRALEPSLRFTSGAEFVTVKYFLIEAAEGSGVAERETVWLPPSDALAAITHPDARSLLRNVLPEIEEEVRIAAARRLRSNEAAFTEFLRVEYEHTADALLRNEEDGEKRAAFFMTLCGATGVALAFLVGPSAVLDTRTRHPIILCVLSIVLLFGYLTFLRILKRNRASDRYKQALQRIRRYFVEDAGDPRRALLAFDPFVREDRPLPSWGSFGRGGWLETVVVLESLVAGFLMAAVISTPRWRFEIVVAGATAAIMWLVLIGDARRRFRKAR